MGKRGLRITFAVIFIAILGVCLWSALSPREPSYKGRSLDQYLDEVATNYPQGLGDDTVMRAIYAMGPRAIPGLRHALRRKDSAYEKTLAFLRPRLPNQITRRLPAPKSDLYWWGLSSAAARGLALFGPQAREAVPDLVACFKEVGAVNSASYAIWQIGPRPEDIPALLAWLNSTNWGAPIQAAQLIPRAGVANAEVLSALTNAAGRGSPWNRYAAIGALGEIGPKAAAVTQLLSANLTDPDALLRIKSADALTKISGGTNPPVAWFVQALDDEVNHGSPPSTVENVSGAHEQILYVAINHLEQTGDQANLAIPSLHKVEDEPAIRLRVLAAEALWKINRETNRLMEIHREALQNSYSGERVNAAKFLSEYALDQGIILPEFDTMLKDSELVVRFYAARALLKLHRPVGPLLPELVASVQDHFSYYNNAEIRQLAAETLGEIGRAARAAVPDLLQALNDPEPKVQTAATNALKHIDPVALR
jgi:HEAT repeat protein